MLVDGILKLSPMPNNYKRKSASMSPEEYSLLCGGEIKLVVVVDRTGGEDLYIDPIFVQKHCKMKYYRVSGLKYAKRIMCFNFYRAYKEQRRNETASSL
jgi:hypothetical protein